MSWRTAETKSRRTYWLMEVITISHHYHQQQTFNQVCNEAHDGSLCIRGIIIEKIGILMTSFVLCCFTVDLVTYITRFQWDMAKYPIKQSLKNISEIISKVFLLHAFTRKVRLFFRFCVYISLILIRHYLCHESCHNSHEWTSLLFDF